ncbi:VWA domain-containing protein [Sedimentibacter sp.]|uniref:VWA domain-containing protein n=1 Tax=Sedimentibacter sp. TaxID=1960295 RepID=UPI0028A9E57C|nr:VWA domain-containing protein [Sedimentibacter sp.]
MKRFISFVLILCMIINVFTGCSKTKTYSDGAESVPGSTETNYIDEMEEDYESPLAGFIAEYLKSYDTSGLTARGLEPETPQTEEVGEWNIPIPEINPLGAQELYDLGTYYRAESGVELSYLDGFAEITKYLSGEEWDFSFSAKTGDVLPFLREYASKIGAEVLPSAFDESFAFRLKKQDAIWWCQVRAENWERVYLYILKQKIFEINKEYKITQNQFDSNGAFRFLMEIPGKKFSLLKLSLPDGMLEVKAENSNEIDNSTMLSRYYARFDATQYKDYAMYDFPQDPGLVEFTLQKYGSEPLPSDFTFCMTETEYDLPGYKTGGLGTLVVKNAPYGRVYVVPQQHVGITYNLGGTSYRFEREEVNTHSNNFGISSGDDIYFTMSPGYYTVVNMLPGELGRSRTQLVPISASEETTVLLPDSLRSANEVLMSTSDDRELTGGITIMEKKDLTKTAELALSVSDPKERDVFPTKENTVITEGGKQVKITDIRREIAPCSVALVIDSSGSMENDMAATVEAAKKFVEALPDNSFVKIVQFSSSVIPHAGEIKTDALKALSGIRPVGATKLYDATMEGLNAVQGKTRPAVVVFTDGVDSREDGRGQGSSNTKDAVVQKISEVKIPVYTIGFGKRLNDDQALTSVDGAPDIQCLTEFAAASKGQYYPAKNPEALNDVFTAIGSKLGNNFVITYERPTENNVSQTPVVSLVIDNSGSMNMSPDEGVDCNYRMEKTKKMLADFIGKLPANAVTQLMTFQGGGPTMVQLNSSQISTIDKVTLLKAIGEMEADRGTPITEALTSAYENIITVLSSKKVIVFHTDSGLEVPEESKEEYQRILSKIKDKGIFVLWIGMGISTPEKEKVFSEAASATNGEYVVSESTSDIMTKLNSLLQKLGQAGEARTTPITAEISYKSEQGENLIYKAQDEAEFTPPQKKGTPIEPEVVKIETGKKANLYTVNAGEENSRGVSGVGVIGKDSILYTKTEIGKSMENKAMELTVREASYFDKLLGLDAWRSNYRFVAFEVQMKNITNEKIPYTIPSIFKHFYISIDGTGMYPASKATWLLENPVTVHGDPSVTIPPGGTVEGMLVFMIPYSHTGYTQQSLHFYDTKYGHIQMPICGSMPDRLLKMENMPQSSPQNITEAFTMDVTAATVESEISKLQAADFAAFRVIEAEFDTKVQALLNIKPEERIYLKYDTESGELLSQLSDVTNHMPFGFSEEVMLAPASSNIVRMAYDIPQALESYKSQLFFDLKDTSAVFPVSEGKTLGAPSPVTEVDGEYVKVRINQLTQLPSQLNLPDKQGEKYAFSQGTVLLDVTFIDKPGNEGTIVPPDFFSLVKSADEIIDPSRTNQSLIFGIGERFAVFEGRQRRALVVFDNPPGNIEDWTLQSKYNKDILVPVAAGDFSSTEIIAYKADVPKNTDFNKMLNGAVDAAVKKYSALGENKYSPVIGLEENDGYDNLVIPPINTHGIKVMNAASNEEQVLKVLSKINCIPKAYRSNYAAESVITQGFGGIASVSDTVMKMFSNIGFMPQHKIYSYTDMGIKILSEYYKFDVKYEGYPVGIAYENAKGEKKVFVVPFMMDLSQLSGLVYSSSLEKPELNYGSDTANVRVYAVNEPGLDGTAAAAAVGIGAALGGEEVGSSYAELLMLEKSMPLDLLSLDPIDLGFAPVMGDGKTGYSAILTTPDEVIAGQNTLQDFKNIYEFRVEFNVLGGVYTHAVTLSEGQKPENLLMTICINLPDLPAKAASVLREASSKAHEAAQRPEPFTVAKWYNRNILYNLIAGQTTFDTEFIQDTDLVLGRLNRPRCIVISSELDSKGGLTTWVNLLQPFNQVHSGDSELQKAYFLVNGFYQSGLESWLLPDGLGTGYMDVWLNAPEDTEILAIPVINGGRDFMADALEEENIYPQTLLRAVRENKRHLFVQSKPTQKSGIERYAWLELNPDTYEVISVFDNGYHGAEYFINTSFLKEGTLEFLKGTWLGLNVSIWTVSFMNLKTQDISKIVTQGRAFALSVGKSLAEFSGNWDAAKSLGEKLATAEEFTLGADEEITDLRTGTDGGGEGLDKFRTKASNMAMDQIFDQLPKFRLFGVDMNDKVKDGFSGFSNGYNTVVDAYFHHFSGSSEHVQIKKEK